MKIAIGVDKLPIAPRRGEVAYCPDCGNVLIAHCGSYVMPYWAHKSGETCVDYISYNSHHLTAQTDDAPIEYEPSGNKIGGWHWWGGTGETDWHLNWKRFWPTLSREVTVKTNGVTHRADVLDSRTGCAIEFQHSPIARDDILSRERFWPFLIWVFDARQVWEHGKLIVTLRRSEPCRESMWNGYEYVRIRCIKPLDIMQHVTCPMFWDIGGGIMIEVHSYQFVLGAYDYPGTIVARGNMIWKGAFLKRFEPDDRTISDLLGPDEWPILAEDMSVYR